MTQSLETTMAAESTASRNLEANLHAIAKTQATLRIDDLPAVGEWLFGRDGYLTARDDSRKWITGCSLPLRAAEEILRKLHVAGPVACFLAPVHAAQIRVALDRLAPEQAIITIVPDARELPTILSCDDFSREIDAHRLWFVAGVGWESNLRALLHQNRGLAIPSQFIRLPTTPQPTIDALVAGAQKIFSELTTARNELIRTLRDRWSARGSDRICVVAPSRFRLWNDAGHVIRSLFNLARIPCNYVNLDDPAGSSPLAILLGAQDCGAIFTIDTGRADSPGLLPGDLPWITWVTSPRVPASAGAGKSDQLLVADANLRETASGEGWAMKRVDVAGIPAMRASDTRTPSALAIIEDTIALDTPVDLIEFSSHVVLWESIALQLLDDPFAVGESVQLYLDARASELQIDPSAVDRGRFIRNLILPAYAQGIARALIRAGLPIKQFGRGWESIPEFAPRAAGAIASRSELESVLGQPVALVHVWPWRGLHAIDSTGKQILRRADNSLKHFIRDARQILDGIRAPSSKRQPPALTAETIKNALNRAKSRS